MGQWNGELRFSYYLKAAMKVEMNKGRWTGLDAEPNDSTALPGPVVTLRHSHVNLTCCSPFLGINFPLFPLRLFARSCSTVQLESRHVRQSSAHSFPLCTRPYSLLLAEIAQDVASRTREAKSRSDPYEVPEVPQYWTLVREADHIHQDDRWRGREPKQGQSHKSDRYKSRIGAILARVVV